MGTISGVWDRLKPLLQSAAKSTPAPNAKADSKKTAAAIDRFNSQFAAILSEFASLDQKRKEIDTKYRAAAEQALKLLTPLLQQLDAAHKDGFNPGSSHDTLDDRMNEMIDRMKDVKTDGSKTQWD